MRIFRLIKVPVPIGQGYMYMLMLIGYMLESADWCAKDDIDWIREKEFARLL